MSYGAERGEAERLRDLHSPALPDSEEEACPMGLPCHPHEDADACYR